MSPMNPYGSWTRYDAAVKLGVSPASIHRWLAGDRYPEPYRIKLIAMNLQWPIEDQLACIPEDGSKNTMYGLAFHQVLSRWWATQPGKTRAARKLQVRKSVVVAQTPGDLFDLPAGTRIATNTNEIYEKDDFQSEPYWITPGEMNRVTSPPSHWFPAYVLPPRRV